MSHEESISSNGRAQNAQYAESITRHRIYIIFTGMIIALHVGQKWRRDVELISRQAAIEAMGKATWAKERLAELPSAEPQRMIATTALQEGQITWRDYKCSNCSHHRGKPMNYCEVCGAKMER